MAEKSERSSFIGIVLMVIFYATLYAAPKLFTQKRFDFSGSTQPFAAQQPFPMDLKMPVMRTGAALKLPRGKISLNDLLSDTTESFVVNFWATWCPPCIEELPSLEYLSRQVATQKGKHPIVVTISVDERAEDISRFYRTLTFQPGILVLQDKDGELARSLGTVKFPETYWVGRDGKIQHKWVGPQNWISRQVIEKIAVSPPL